MVSEAQHFSKAALLSSLPPEWPASSLPFIRDTIAARRQKVVVLDDDPTGTQTVHEIPVLTEWSVASLKAELASDLSCFYVLTNSRSLPAAHAAALNREIASNLLHAAQALRAVGHPSNFAVVSRSDSTLRGHFAEETNALTRSLGPFDAILLIPFFQAGGRFTINDTHFVADGDTLVPSADTHFARDAVFGYRSSNLREWIQEKMGGTVLAETVESISLEDIRLGGPDRVRQKFMELSRGRFCVVNAATIRDLEVAAHALVLAEGEGRRFLCRTAASFVPVRAGIPCRPELTQEELRLPSEGGGLIAVGSYVPNTTEQLQPLLQDPSITRIKLEVAELLNPAERPRVLETALNAMNAALQGGRDTLLYTSRELITGKTAEATLAFGQQVSSALVWLVQNCQSKPRYLLAKGGITSSDIATSGLGVKRAWILGQILPGVPVWKLGPEARYPDLTYIVFPGNVGDPQALANLRQKLNQSSSAIRIRLEHTPASPAPPRQL